MLAHSIFFYIFSLIAIISAIMVTVSKYTVHAVFFLILDFISISCLFIMIGAEFLGMIMLIGLVTKNGILIVEFANQKRELGLSKRQAVLEAAQQRLRPILMTSLATAFGALPIALSLGAASTSRIPLGIVIVGGIIFSLFLTLLVIPAVYTYISGKHEPKKTNITE